MASSPLVAILLMGMVRRVDDPSSIVPEPSLWQPLNVSRAIEIQIRPDLGPSGIEVRKIGRDGKIVIDDHTR